MQRPELLEAILELALGDADLDLCGVEVDVTDHAVLRYRERVESGSPRLAARRLRDLAGSARWRSRPLGWTRVVLRPGVIYGYSPDNPDVCLLVRDGAVVTVLTRRMFARAVIPRPRHGCGPRSSRSGVSSPLRRRGR